MQHYVVVMTLEAAERRLRKMSTDLEALTIEEIEALLTHTADELHEAAELLQVNQE